jgi:phosphatidate cytidylyltransferase
VRYKKAQEKSMPLFRTIQWTWFALAMLYICKLGCYGVVLCYLLVVLDVNCAQNFPVCSLFVIVCADGESLHKFCSGHRQMVHLTHVTQYIEAIVFALYCALFMITVLTFKTGLIRFQISQLMWTIVTVVMVVCQTKFLAQCALNGLFWFFFPMATVVMNDVSAYFCGITMGKKFIQTPFLALSPKKTWEGFLGAGVLTCVFSFLFPVLLARYPWFTCPAEKLTFIPPAIDSITCSVHEIFLPRDYAIPTLFGLSGQSVSLLPIQLHGVAYGLFASLVAPFGKNLAL